MLTLTKMLIAVAPLAMARRTRTPTYSITGDLIESGLTLDAGEEVNLVISLSEHWRTSNCNDYELDLATAHGVYEVLDNSLRCSGNRSWNHIQRFTIQASE